MNATRFGSGRREIIAALLITAAATAASQTTGESGITTAKQTRHAQETETMKPHAYVGMWVTGGGHIRHELLPNGRYDEQRGSRKSAYRGRYSVTGDHIDYVDDTGFTADGDFVDGVLHHAGMILYRER